MVAPGEGTGATIWAKTQPSDRLRQGIDESDSYGVHACDVDLLNRVLREEFVRSYSEPVLQKCLNQQRKAHPGISLPDPPPTGDLDIRQVLSSLYFFA
jgi:DNA-directed RNA polymerase